MRRHPRLRVGTTRWLATPCYLARPAATLHTQAARMPRARTWTPAAPRRARRCSRRRAGVAAASFAPAFATPLPRADGKHATCTRLAAPFARRGSAPRRSLSCISFGTSRELNTRTTHVRRVHTPPHAHRKCSASAPRACIACRMHTACACGRRLHIAAPRRRSKLCSSPRAARRCIVCSMPSPQSHCIHATRIRRAAPRRSLAAALHRAAHRSSLHRLCSRSRHFVSAPHVHAARLPYARYTHGAYTRRPRAQRMHITGTTRARRMHAVRTSPRTARRARRNSSRHAAHRRVIRPLARDAMRAACLRRFTGTRRARRLARRMRGTGTPHVQTACTARANIACTARARCARAVCAPHALLFAHRRAPGPPLLAAAHLAARLAAASFDLASAALCRTKRVQPHAARVPRTRAWMFALRRAAPLLPLLSSPRGDRRCIVRSCVRNAVAAGVRHTRNMYPPRRAVRSPWLCTAPLTAASFGARVHDAHRSTTGTERCGSRAQRAHDARGPRARRMLAVCTSPRAAPTVSLAAAHLAARGSPPHRSLSYHIVHSRVPYAATTHITPTWALRRHGGASHC